MQPVYREIIDRELPTILGKFAPLRDEFRKPVSHVCINVLCKSMYGFAFTPDNSHGFLYLDERLDIEMRPTAEDCKAVSAIFIDFTGLARKIVEMQRKEKKPHLDMRDLTDAAEYVAERMGCSDYCNNALRHLTEGLDSSVQRPN